MRAFHFKWYDEIVDKGRLDSLGHQIGNYPPLYIYFLTAATWLPLPPLYSIKIVHCVFDYVAAFFIYRIVRLVYPGRWWPPRCAFLVALFLPTMILNASFWGQCDSMYTAGLIACVYYLMAGKSAGALQRRIPVATFGIVGWVYVAFAIPPILMGRPAGDLILLYIEQPIQPRPALTFGAPNLYQWLSDDYFSVLFPAGIFWQPSSGLSLLCLCFAASLMVWMERDGSKRRSYIYC